MKKYLEILKKCELFSEIDDDNLLRMLTCLGARVVKFDKKYTIFKEGTTPKFIGIVLSGAVQSMRIDYAGNRSILSISLPCELLCEEFACAKTKSLPIRCRLMSSVRLC